MIPLAIAVAVALAAVALGCYWLFIVTEAAFLGPRAVVRLYDRGADTYDACKRFDRHDESAMIANPLLDRWEASVPLGATPPAEVTSRVLDVAAGTGRVAASLLPMPHFAGSVVCLDLSARMLAEASRKAEAWGGRCVLVRHGATPLPFADRSFDAVTLLEALEFLPDRHEAVREIARVLVPGGWLLVANRTGIDRWLFPGRVDTPAAFTRRLHDIGFEEVSVQPWLAYYDLVWARKRPEPASLAMRSGSWMDALRCPRCLADGRWSMEGDIATCRDCGATAARCRDIWDLTRS